VKAVESHVWLCRLPCGKSAAFRPGGQPLFEIPLLPTAERLRSCEKMWICHAERSEASCISLRTNAEILRYAQDDMLSWFFHSFWAFPQGRRQSRRFSYTLAQRAGLSRPSSRADSAALPKWIPASAGMTRQGQRACLHLPRPKVSALLPWPSCACRELPSSPRNMRQRYVNPLDCPPTYSSVGAVAVLLCGASSSHSKGLLHCR